MNRWKQIGIGSMVALSVLGGAGAAVGASAPPPDPPAPSASAPDTDATASAAPHPTGPRLHALCMRAPRLLERTTRLVDRLEGDAQTRGSLEWLQAQIDNAQAAGRDGQVTVLTNRLHVRQAQLDLLKDRRDLLSELAAACQDVTA